VNSKQTGQGIDPKTRLLIIGAALMALFLGAMDALIMSAAMPTIVADLGGLHLYSWVYSTYFLSRAVSLPIFGKLADLYNNKRIFLISIAIFVVSSVAAGFSPNMMFLIVARVFQGIGAGGNFALVYIVLADISPPQERARTMSFASSIWGIASVLGPTLGGFIVTFLSWRWIFFINVPLGLLSMAGLAFFLKELREKKDSASLDLWGVITLSTAILGLLTLFLMGGGPLGWPSPRMVLLGGVTVLSAAGFYYAERRAREPILPLEFFQKRGFSMGNLAVFMCSFSIFSLFAFAPVFIQGGLGKSPMQVGVAMLSLSLGWSAGSLILGQVSNRLGIKRAAVMGAVLLISGCSLTLMFSVQTTMVTCFWVFMLIGLGMGFVTLATLVVVQNAVYVSDLGVATSSNQFARTLGGTVGVGICGGFMNAALWEAMHDLAAQGLMPANQGTAVKGAGNSFDALLQPEFQNQLTENARAVFQAAIVDSVSIVFWIVLISAVVCLVFCALLPGESDN
jgi:EmrB/QacA subfamily drug resistance transporter